MLYFPSYKKYVEFSPQTQRLMLGLGASQCNGFPCDIGSVRIPRTLYSTYSLAPSVLPPSSVLDDPTAGGAFIFSPVKSSRRTRNSQDSTFPSSRRTGVRKKVSMLPQTPPLKNGHAGYAVGYATERNARSSSSPILMSCIISPVDSIGRTPRSGSTPS